MLSKIILRVAMTLVVVIVFSATQAQTGPGGVGNSNTNKIWLKADAGIADPTVNSRIGYWADQSGNGFNAVQNLTVSRPTYSATGINSKPTVHFERTTALQYFEITTGGVNTLVSNSNTMFVVAKVNSGGADNNTNAYQGLVVIPGYHSGIAALGFPDVTRAYVTNWLGGTIPGSPPAALSNSTSLSQGTWNFFARRMLENINGTTESAFLNGSLISAPSDARQMTQYNPNLIRIGTAFTSGSYTWGLNGDISEIIVYNTAVNDAERIIIENYLSSKYQHPIPNDRFAYDNANEYATQVAGIGREDATNIHQSANSHILNLKDASALDDGEYVLFGHNDQSLAPNNLNAPSGMKRVDRVWRADITGDPGTVLISFDLKNFSLSATQNYEFLLDEDGDFSNATRHTGTISNGTLYSSSPISLSDGSYISLGYVQNGPSAPILLSYDPSQKLLVYGTSYATATPQVNDGGGTTSFSLLTAIPGVVVNTTNGIISFDGTTTPGNYSLNVVATNAYGSSTFNSAYTLTVIPYTASKLEYSSATVSVGNSLGPILPNLPANAFQYSLVSGSLNGLALNAQTGAISGLLQSEGTTTATISATPLTPNATGGVVSTTVNFYALSDSGPAGIGSSLTNKVWLDADYLTGLSNGARLTTFQDRSGNGWNAAQATASRKPTYFLNQLNGKPVIHFDRSSTIQYMELNSTGIGALMSNTNSIFVIAKANTGGMDNSTNGYQSLIAAPGYHSTISFSGYPNTTGTFILNYVGGTIPNSPTSTYVGHSAPLTQGTWQMLSRRVLENNGGTTQFSFTNGLPMGIPAKSNSLMTNYNTNMVRIGSALASGSYSWPLNGAIAEIIVYNTNLNDAQQAILDNYLSAKYSLTIDNDKYISHDPVYIRDVQGIGTTDGTLSNKHSIASNSKGLRLTEMNSSLNATSEFLFVGHASATNALITSDLPASIQQRWERVWYLEKTGSIDAKLSFDVSDAGLSVPSNLVNEFSYYRILYKASPSATFSAIPILPTLENGDQLSFALDDVQLVNGYYTVGYSEGIVWTGTLNEDWNQPGNWSLNRIPASTDYAVVNSCTTCPRLNSAVNIAGLQLNSGSAITLEGFSMNISNTAYLNQTKVLSNQGIINSSDFVEIKNSSFEGALTLQKTGGATNSSYGGNKFSTEVKIINSSSFSWQIATQSDNIVRKL